MLGSFRGKCGQEKLHDRVQQQDSLCLIQYPFPYDCVIPGLNLPPITIDDRPTHIIDRTIPQICFQMLFLLPLETLLLLWTPLLIIRNSLSCLLMILTFSMAWNKKSFTMTGWKDDTDLGNMMKKDATKRLGSIDPHDLIKIINFTTVMSFPGLIQRWGLASWNINIVCTKYSVYWCFCLPYIFYFNCWTHFCACFIPVPLITPCSNTYVYSAWNFDRV